MRTLILILLIGGVLTFLFWIAAAEPATFPHMRGGEPGCGAAGSAAAIQSSRVWGSHPFGWTAEAQTCLWCGRKLAKADPYFDTDQCGRLWAEQMAVRGYRVHAEELVDVNGDVAPHPP
jgi:hypothetical protein